MRGSHHGKLHVFVPRLMDADNTNAQNLNAKAMLARFGDTRIHWHAVHYDAPDTRVLDNPNVTLHRLARGRLWPWHLMLLYLKDWDGIFYPGNEWFDARGLAVRGRLGKQAPVVSTLEGLPGDADRERELGKSMGQDVYCFRPRSGESFTRLHDAVRARSDHIIAISPFLQRAGKFLYKKPFSVLTLGIEAGVFHDALRARKEKRPTVVGVGTVYPGKRPEVFVALARSIPEANFVWVGDGPDLEKWVAEIEKSRLENILFLGSCTPDQLAEILQSADIFVLPSLAEGVPKAAQEAAACGLPVIIYKYYEAPLIKEGRNGFLVENDEQMEASLRKLLDNQQLALELGSNGSRMANQLSWDVVAQEWEFSIGLEIERDQ